MEIDPRRLRILRSVALRGGVVDAARLLHLTPSAVSQQLMQLEREVGLPLLDRSGRRIALTAAGRVLAARAEHIEAELAGARRELAALSGRVAGRVVAAGFPTAIRHLLVPALGALAESHPEVQPSVVELEGPEARRELRTGGVDVVISERDSAAVHPTPAAIAEEVLFDDEYRVVAPASWATTPRSMADLTGVPWVASPPDTACGRALDRLAVAHAFAPKRVHTATEFPAVLALVAAGFGAAIVPLIALVDAPAGAVAVAAIPGAGFRRLCVLYRAAARGPEPVVTVLLDALRRAAAALDPLSLLHGR